MRGVSLRRRVHEGALANDAKTWSFSCSGALYFEFESRAVALGCSVDWLMTEAMQRLLAETRDSLPSFPPPSSAAFGEPPAPVSQIAPRMPSAGEPIDDDLRATEQWLLPPGPPPPSPAALPADIVLAVGGVRVRVDREPFVIGRQADEGIDLVIEQQGVSRRHAMLERGENGWLIFDLGSKNGTLVNDVAVTGAPLRPGDLISLGPVFVSVVAVEAPAS